LGSFVLHGLAAITAMPLLVAVFVLTIARCWIIVPNR